MGHLPNTKTVDKISQVPAFLYISDLAELWR